MRNKKRKKYYIVPLEITATLHQMTGLNREMNYETVMTNVWPTGSENNTELIEEYAPMTGIMINMKHC